MIHRRDASPTQRLQQMVGEMQTAGMTLRDIDQAAHVGHTTVWHAALGETRKPSLWTASPGSSEHPETCVEPPKR